MVPPTDCTEFTELLAEWSLPQIAQIYTEAACRVEPPTDCTEFTETLAECILPQIAQIYTDG